MDAVKGAPIVGSIVSANLSFQRLSLSISTPRASIFLPA
jgi:hypothetical protein